MRNPLECSREIMQLVVRRPVVDSANPRSLAKMRDAMQAIALAIDEMFVGLARETEIGDRDSQHVGTIGFENSLKSVMGDAIERAERAERKREAFDPTRAWGTINHEHQGIRR